MATHSGEFRTYMKKGKRLMHAGKYRRAEYWFLLAREIADHENKTGNKALATHRLAEVAVLADKEPMLARRRFQHALKEISGDNTLGRIILLRDYGNFELLQGDVETAKKRIEQAVRLIEACDTTSPRAQTEAIVTDGFQARTELGGPRHEAAVETLRQIAQMLHGYKKPEYELANLYWLINSLPLMSIERLSYVARSIELSFRQRDFKRAGEFTALLGGSPLKSAYGSIVN